MKSRLRITFAVGIALLWGIAPLAMAVDPPPRPNIVWITSEDHGPHLGCYGDLYATTPNIDRLAARGIRYTCVWSCAPVCAPARTTLISGLYANSTGAEHMRSRVPYPQGQVMFPERLRAAGYYCTNNAKTDYNLAESGQVWDESSNRAHWKRRPAGKPFFAVFNSGQSHEGQIRARSHNLRHDPARVRLPAYHPDEPEVRHDWAAYYDGVSGADADAGLRLRELEDSGLLDDTIVFYFSDHGAGMPRCKRWPYDSGLRVPLVVYIPEKFQQLRPVDYAPGGKSERVISFVDFAPTVLSLAGIEPPAAMQGQAFLGPRTAAPHRYAFGFRGRMDERYDLVRSVTDGRYVYIRNFMPHRIYGQHIVYMFQMPTTMVWKRLFDAGRLTAAQGAFWREKPAEELYDLEGDPDEVDNLVNLPEHRARLTDLRQALRDWILDIRDVGFLPEGEMHARSAGASPYDLAHDEPKYPLSRILETAELATQPMPESLDRLVQSLDDIDSAVRYWGAVGLLIRSHADDPNLRSALMKAIEDHSPYVRIVAAEALARVGDRAGRERGQAVLAELASAPRPEFFVAMATLNAIDCLDAEQANVLKPRFDATALRKTSPDPRYRDYISRLLTPVP